MIAMRLALMFLTPPLAAFVSALRILRGSLLVLLLWPVVLTANPNDAPAADSAAAPDVLAVAEGESEGADAAETAAVTEPEKTWQPLKLLDAQVPVESKHTLRWSSLKSFAGLRTDVPVLVANGHSEGPVLCIIAAIHGDELNGIEMVRRVIEEVDPSALKGAVIGVPIVNLYGFQRGSRYLPDRRDLNRFFPGNADGSSASRIARAFFDEIIRHCSAVVDIHTGSFHRTNLTQLRADLSNKDVVDLTKGFGGLSVLDDKGSLGTLRRAATAAGIPSVTLEAGEPMRLQESHVKSGVRGITSLMSHLGMIDEARFWTAPQPVFYASTWVRSERGGILLSVVPLGAQVAAGDVLGTVTDPVTNVRSEIVSTHSGRVLGMALNQVVMPGFAAYRIGIRRTEKEVSEQAEASAAEAEAEAAAAQAAESQPDTPGKVRKRKKRPVQEEQVVPVDPDERPE